jgi:hypothetical protein
MKNSAPWPQTLRVRLDAKEMLRFARQEAFRDDDFPLTLTWQIISLRTKADFFSLSSMIWSRTKTAGC